VLLYCCYTPAHAGLYREIFLPSVPDGFEVRATEIPIEGPGDYLSREFLDCIRKKIDLVVRSIEENADDVIVWSDVDIRFFRLTDDGLRRELTSSGKEILFQRESPRMPDVNTGFFVCRCSPTLRKFFSTVREQLRNRADENEQMAVNRLLIGRGYVKAAGKEPSTRNPAHETALDWGYLPATFYARTHGWPPPKNPAIYHANYTKGADGIGQKFSQFKEIDVINRLGPPARLWSILRRIPRKIRPRP